MDHVWNSIEPFYEAEAGIFLDEWKSGEYQKWSDCPSYESLRTIIKAANIIRDYLGWSRLAIKDLINDGIW
jgi:hypothetical protein